MIHSTVYGRLVADPSFRENPGVCNFTIASRNSRLVNGAEKTEFVRCAVWGKRGEVCAKHLHKGDSVMACGELVTDEYTGRDGERRIAVTLEGANVEFAGKAAGGRSDVSSPSQESTGADSEDEPLPF